MNGTSDRPQSDYGVSGEVNVFLFKRKQLLLYIVLNDIGRLKSYLELTVTLSGFKRGNKKW